MEHARDIQVDFDEFSQLDENLCKVYMKINKYWNSTYLRLLFNKHLKEIQRLLNFSKRMRLTLGALWNIQLSVKH